MGSSHRRSLTRGRNLVADVDSHRTISLMIRSMLFATLIVYAYRLYYTFIEPPSFELLYDCIPPLSSSWMRSLCFDHTWLPLNTLWLGLLAVMWVGMLAFLAVASSAQ